MHSNGDCVFQNFFRRTNWWPRRPAAAETGCLASNVNPASAGARDLRMKSRIHEAAMRETYGGKPKTMNSPRQVVFASPIGTAIEFFDFYIYATAAVLVFRSLFFSASDPASATPVRWQRSQSRSSRDRSAQRGSGACEDPSGRRGCDPRP